MAPPNLLFLFTDEQRADTLAAYGNTRIQMPNLNRLASESVVFDPAYVTQPVCTPSRSSIMTGLWPHTNGCTENNVPLAPDTPCLPERIERGDYATAYHGKWHLGDEIFAQHGFDEWISIEDGYRSHYREGRDRAARSSYHHFLVENGFAPANGEAFGRGETARFAEESSKPAFLAREASRFIRAHAAHPWILYVNFLEPHMPFFGPRDDQHAPEAIELPGNFECVPDETQPLKTRLLAEHYRRQSLASETDWRRLIANYWGLCSLVDTHVGTILDTLDACGLRDNTIVVYTSDHGDMMGSHRLLAKCVMFEEAVRVPMLVRLPGQSASRRVRGPVSQIDLVPTLLDLLGQPVPAELSGKSLRHAVERSGDEGLEEHVCIEWNGPNNGLGDVNGSVQVPDWMETMAPRERIAAATRDPVRTVVSPDGWKLNCSPLGEHELYNLAEDPGETNNRAAEAEQRPRMQALADRLRRWQDETNDTIELPRFA